MDTTDMDHILADQTGIETLYRIAAMADGDTLVRSEGLESIDTMRYQDFFTYG